MIAFFVANGTWELPLYSIINSVVSGATLLWVLSVSYRLGGYAKMLDTMWQAYIHRGIVDGAARGFFEVRSPVRLINNSGDILCEMKDELRAFYETKCKGKTEQECGKLIEAEFGARLTEKIWIPNNIVPATGLIIAVAVAMGKETLTGILDHTLVKKQEPPPETDAECRFDHPGA